MYQVALRTTLRQQKQGDRVLSSLPGPQCGIDRYQGRARTGTEHMTRIIQADSVGSVPRMQPSVVKKDYL